MTPSQLTSFLSAAFKCKRKVLVAGPPGVGKSEIVERAARLADADYIVRNPPIEDPTDPKGVPWAWRDNGGEPVAAFIPTKDLAALIHANKLTVVHLEDFGQTPVSVQAGYMQMLQARRINGHRISDHVVFVASTNDASHKAGVIGLIEPVKSRFDSIVQLDVSLQDWSEWALDNQIPVELVAFIRLRPDLLHQWNPVKGLVNQPMPRTWTNLGRWQNDGIKDLEVWEGCVGKGAATEYWQFLDILGQVPSPDEIKLNPDTTPVPEKPSHLYAVAAGIARHANKQTFDRFMRYLWRMPQMFRVFAIMMAQKSNPEIVGTKGFVEWAIKNELPA